MLSAKTRRLLTAHGASADTIKVLSAVASLGAGAAIDRYVEETDNSGFVRADRESGYDGDDGYYAGIDSAAELAALLNDILVFKENVD